MQKARVYIVLMSTAITLFFGVALIHQMSGVFEHMAKVVPA